MASHAELLNSSVKLQKQVREQDPNTVKVVMPDRKPTLQSLFPPEADPFFGNDNNRKVAERIQKEQKAVAVKEPEQPEQPEQPKAANGKAKKQATTPEVPAWTPPSA